MRNKATARNDRGEGTMVASNPELEWMKAKVLRFSEIRSVGTDGQGERECATT
jgi:hypothetical protein